MIKKKYIIIFLIILILSIFILFSWKKGIEYSFDMKEINGISDNNPYGIRNDMYDFIIKFMDDSNIPEFKEQRIKNIMLNYVKSDLIAIKNFSNKSVATEVLLNSFTIRDCVWSLSLIENKYQKADNYLDNLVGKYYSKSNYSLQLEKNNKDIVLISNILDSYLNGMILNPDDRSPLENPKLCYRYMDHVLNEEDFFYKE